MDENISTATLPGGYIDYTEQLDELIVYAEIATGGIIELVWIAKTFLIFFIIFSAWKVVRK